jgi:chemotaxis protein CheD
LKVVEETIQKDGYFDQALQVNLVAVMAGFYRWSRDPSLAFTTTLGSCVSVCAYDPVRKIGGMNHFLLPDAPQREENNNITHFNAAERYGGAAIERLLNALYTHGATKDDLIIKIFGGGKVLSGVSADVGQRNVAFAQNFFRREDMKIESQDTGKTYGRKIVFFPTTGKVLLRTLDNNQDLEKVAAKENKILGRLSHEKVEDDIELF